MGSELNRESLCARVLVVDDQEDVRSLLDHQLDQEQFEVETVENGAAAIHRVRREENRPRVVVLDLSMPVMDGFETLRRLRDLDEEVFTVVLTGHGGEENKLRAFDLGADDYVTKPFSTAVLARRIRRLLELGQSSSDWPGRWEPTQPVDRNSEP